MTIAQSYLKQATGESVVGIDAAPAKKKKIKPEGQKEIDTLPTRAHEENQGERLLIHEDDRNYRQHDQRNLDLIGKSLDDLGCGRSIVADASGAVIGGNGTLRMANQRGIPIRQIETDGNELICVVRKDLKHDDPRRAQLAIMDNSTTDSSTFDYELMQEDFSIEDLEELGVEVPEVEIMEEQEAVPGETDPDAIPNVEEETPVSTRGKVYQLGKHRLMCGDSTSAEDVALLMNGEKADMVFTDPPYGMGLDTDYSSMQNNSKMTKEKNLSCGKKYAQGKVDEFSPKMVESVLALKAVECFLWGADYYAELLPNKNDGSWVVWDKRLDESADKMYGSCFELCWSKKNHKRDISRIKWASVFGTEQEFDHKRHHPTQKPIALVAWFLERYGKAGETVVDLFGGSGPTLIACEQTNRKCRMMELDEHYCDVIRRRWAEFKYGEGCDWQSLTPEA
jgi:DNA modification methylase